MVGLDFFENEMGIVAFLRVIILEGDGVNDFTIKGGAIECCFADGGDGATEEGSIFLSDRHRFSLKD